MLLEIEDWELTPDDWHDNADVITNEGRRQLLESLFVLEDNNE